MQVPHMNELFNIALNTEKIFLFVCVFFFSINIFKFQILFISFSEVRRSHVSALRDEKHIILRPKNKSFYRMHISKERKIVTDYQT